MTTGDFLRADCQFEQRLQAGAQIGDCLFRRSAVANRPYTRTEQGGGAPGAVLRLMHHAHVCQTAGESIRLTQAIAGQEVIPLS